MNYLKPFIAIFAVIVILFGACDKEAVEETQYTVSFKAAGDATYPLYAGQDEYVGDLIITVDGDNNLWATFSSNGSCEFTEFALFVGELSDVPLSGGGTPTPGHFNYKNETGEFGPINLNGLSDDFVILAHAVCGEETIWAQPLCVPIVDDYSFENVFGTRRWGWIIVPNDEDCAEDANLISIKTWFIDNGTNERVWATVETNVESYSNLCSQVGVISATEGVYDLFGYYGEKLGELTVTKENDALKLVITPSDEVKYSAIRSHVYFGDNAGFEPYIMDECPDYKNFPLFKEELLPFHEFIIE